MLARIDFRAAYRKFYGLVFNAGLDGSRRSLRAAVVIERKRFVPVYGYFLCRQVDGYAFRLGQRVVAAVRTAESYCRRDRLAVADVLVLYRTVTEVDRHVIRAYHSDKLAAIKDHRRSAVVFAVGRGNARYRQCRLAYRRRGRARLSQYVIVFIRTVYACGYGNSLVFSDVLIACRACQSKRYAISVHLAVERTGHDDIRVAVVSLACSRHIGNGKLFRADLRGRLCRLSNCVVADVATRKSCSNGHVFCSNVLIGRRAAYRKLHVLVADNAFKRTGHIDISVAVVSLACSRHIGNGKLFRGDRDRCRHSFGHVVIGACRRKRSRHGDCAFADVGRAAAVTYRNLDTVLACRERTAYLNTLSHAVVLFACALEGHAGHVVIRFRDTPIHRDLAVIVVVAALPFGIIRVVQLNDRGIFARFRLLAVGHIVTIAVSNAGLLAARVYESAFRNGCGD